MPLEALFNRLPGTWILTRALQSDAPLAAPLGTVQGIATFVQGCPAALDYQEHGQWMTPSGDCYAIQQAYRYRYEASTTQLIKYAITPQGKLQYLYPLKLANSPMPSGDIMATGQLQCHLDHYQARYQFKGGINFHQFSLTYQVTGPKKSYRSTSLFERSISGSGKC